MAKAVRRPASPGSGGRERLRPRLGGRKSCGHVGMDHGMCRYEQSSLQLQSSLDCVCPGLLAPLPLPCHQHLFSTLMIVPGLGVASPSWLFSPPFSLEGLSLCTGSCLSSPGASQRTEAGMGRPSPGWSSCGPHRRMAEERRNAQGHPREGHSRTALMRIRHHSKHSPCPPRLQSRRRGPWPSASLLVAAEPSVRRAPTTRPLFTQPHARVPMGHTPGPQVQPLLDLAAASPQGS